MARFSNLLNFDVMTLGNHEFDDGIGGLAPYLRNQSAPCVVSNIDTAETPQLAGLCRPSAVLSVGGRRVGVVGYLTRDTLEVSNPGRLGIRDEVEAVRRETERLHNQGVDIIIALGHSGYGKDMQIARAVPHLDLVVGGHTHSFLYPPNLDNPSNNRVEGAYPTIVSKPGGGRAAVVQAYAFTKYLGKLELSFDSGGELKSWWGSPLLLDSSIKEDPAIRAELLLWREQLDKIRQNLVGYSDVVLSRSREGESSIGNFVTDAMVWGHRQP